MRHKNQPENNRAAALTRLAADATHQSGVFPPSSERVSRFVENVLRCPRADRLKMLALRAALNTIASHAGGVECVTQINRLRSCEQVEWNSLDRGRTLYCHPLGPVSSATIDEVIPPDAREWNDLAHIIFVTTDPVEPTVREYAAAVYQQTNGIEFAILDCLGFVRHFLHLFHRHRAAFLDAYQTLVLSESDSAVSFALKQAFLALRQAATTEPETDA